MKTSLFAFAIAIGALGCQKAGGAGRGGAVAAPDLKTEDDKTLYALGLLLGRNLGTFNLTSSEMAFVQAGLADAATGQKPKVEIEQYGPKVNQMARTRANARAETEKAKAKPFLEAAAKESGAETTSSGLVFRSLKPGTGDSPKATDMVKVNYHGTLTDGTVFDSSIQRGQPAEFQLNRVIPCWTEAVQKMKMGEKAKLTCPSTIAYGDGGRPPKIPGGATLIFEIELLEIKKPPTPAAGGMTPGGASPGHPGTLPPKMSAPPGHP